MKTQNLKLSASNPSGILELTDNSGVTATKVFNDAGVVYQIISGSNGIPSAASSGPSGYYSNSGSYGLLMPDIGIALLAGEPLSASFSSGGCGISINRTSNTSAGNQKLLFTAISGAASFRINSQETVASDYVFVRARNADFNYSENPSFISRSAGEVLFPLFVDSPTTYITTIGLYNDSNELLAVAKLSRPLEKDFTKELLCRVRLDF